MKPDLATRTDLRSLFTLSVKRRVSLGTNLILSQLTVTCSEVAINLFSSPGSEEQRAISGGSRISPRGGREFFMESTSECYIISQ